MILDAEPEEDGRRNLPSLRTDHPIHPALRIAIPVLRLLTWWAALNALAGAELVIRAEPLRKLFYAPLVSVAWGCLALIPFILIRPRRAYIVYCVLSAGVLGFMLYDEFVPFRYVASDYHGEVREGYGYSRSGNDDYVRYWISYHTPADAEDWGYAVFQAWPLIMASLYHFAYNRSKREARKETISGSSTDFD